MGGDVQFLDIILFAVIAAFVVLQLRRVLGRRDGHEGGYVDPFRRPDQPPLRADKGASDNVVELPSRLERPEPPASAEPANSSPAVDFAGIRAADPKFDPNEFLSGARVAFGMIIDAYASGDVETLKPLLSREVFENFERAIRERETKGWILEKSLEGISSSEIVEAYLQNQLAHITVKFVSNQIDFSRDKEGQVVEGNPDRIQEVTDFWTFARDTGRRDPNWQLVATASLD